MPAWLSYVCFRCEPAKGRYCEGFRMTAHRDGSACTGAVVRKPPVKERAGDEVAMVMPGYGDLIAVLVGDARRESMAVS
jgi:hypothetical protein